MRTRIVRGASGPGVSGGRSPLPTLVAFWPAGCSILDLGFFSTIGALALVLVIGTPPWAITVIAPPSSKLHSITRKDCFMFGFLQLELSSRHAFLRSQVFFVVSVATLVRAS